MKTLFTSHKLPLDKCPWGLRTNLGRWQALNSEYTFKYFDDSQMDRWMEENIEPETFQLYDKLNNGAPRADVFRFWYVYVEGGVWIDADLPAFNIRKLDKKFAQRLKENKAYITRRQHMNTGYGSGPYDAGPRMVFFGGVAGNSLFKRMVDEQMRSISNALDGVYNEDRKRGNFHDKHLPNLTGPWVWEDVVTKACNLKSFWADHKPLTTYTFEGGSLIIVPGEFPFKGAFRYKSYHHDVDKMGAKKWWGHPPFKEATQ